MQFISRGNERVSKRFGQSLMRLKQNCFFSIKDMFYPQEQLCGVIAFACVLGWLNAAFYLHT